MTGGGWWNEGKKAEAKFKKNVSLENLKPKDLVGIPWLVAFALRDDGWYLRSEITWCKKAPMPESVKDRPTHATEKIFLLTKSPNYYYDQEAVREESSGSYNGSSFTKGKTAAVKPNVGQGERIERPGRNMWNYWLLGPEPFPEAHFAVFPTEIPRRAILAGTSPKACPKCGAPWERIIERTGHVNKREPAHAPKSCPTKTDSTGWAPTKRFTNMWRSTCSCGIEETAPCVVLDPFGGSGTVSLVATWLQRNSIYIDLNPKYLEMAIERCGFRGLCHADTWEVIDVRPKTKERVGEQFG